MSYTVLARKYRSRTFDEVIGQEPIATTLANAIATGRVHHGYLFCGTRGVGKTSMARILAKALNCLKHDAPTTEPCNECDSCTAIAAGEDVDVIEIDAASNTGVDNIRELRSNAIYRPARSRFKVYIIDEVHMLSTGAFNALLKTLEEPPSHVKFIMATTEPEKVPATIQSRCQRFDFRPIPAALIAEQTAKICKAEKIDADEAVLRRIARLANGSMRDALSLLDQLFSLGAERLTLDLLEQVLPQPGDEQVADLMDRVIGRDAAGALAVLDEVVSAGHSLQAVVGSLIEHVRAMMLLRICGETTELVDVADALRARMAQQSKAFDEPAYVFMLAFLEELRRSVRYSGTGRALVEAAVVRLCLMDAFMPLGAVERAVSAEGGGPARGEPAPAVSRGRAGKKADSPSSPDSAAAGDSDGAGRPGRARLQIGRTAGDAASRPPRPVAAAPREPSSGAVRKALELFEGTLVSVRPLSPSAAAPAGNGKPNGQEEQAT